MIKINRLTQISERVGGGHSKILFRCDCGTEKPIDYFSVKYGRVKSCGCLNSELAIKRNIENGTHGLTKTVEYNSWQSMKARVTYKNDPYYKDYGLRGITICDRWMNSFENFLEDMGKKPSKDLSLDREDNDGNYEPSNCRWATASQQQSNKRKRKGFSSLYRGVFFRESRGKFVASLKLVCGKSLHIGYFVKEEDAAKAYNAKVVELGLCKPLNLIKRKINMLVDNAGGKDFKPDPLLDLDVDYEARIVGLVHIGRFQKQKHDGKNFIEDYTEIEQAIVLFELTEPETFVERGTDDNKHMVPRQFSKFIKYSSHEKSALFEMAKAANPKAAYMDKKKPIVDTSLMIGSPVNLTLKNNKDGDKQNIAKVGSYPAKHRNSVPEMIQHAFQYSVHTGAHPVGDIKTTIEDVPVWMLKFALKDALDVSEFGQLDIIEEHVQAVDDAKDADTELEGDRLEDKKSKTDPKEKVEDKVKPSARRSRRAAKPAEDEVDYSNLDVNALEDKFIELGGKDASLDELSTEAGEDDNKFKELVIEAIKAL